MSCAGSVESWKLNEKYKIVNYPLLASVIAEKVKNGKTTLSEFENEISQAQQYLLAKGNSKLIMDKLKIGKYEIEFPNINSDFTEIIATNARTFAVLPDFEAPHC